MFLLCRNAFFLNKFSFYISCFKLEFFMSQLLPLTIKTKDSFRGLILFKYIAPFIVASSIIYD